jgi:hypothetical protein
MEYSSALFFAALEKISNKKPFSEKCSACSMINPLRYQMKTLITQNEITWKEKITISEIDVPNSSGSCAWQWKKVQSITFFLEFSLVTFFVSRQRK